MSAPSNPPSEPPPAPVPPERPSLAERFRRAVLGRPRNVQDPRVFHHVSLVAFLAWVGLGADGLSSSAYGPEEAFKALGQHTYLAVGLALATALTVFIISYAYSRIIEHFPFGGGGYIVASRLLGPSAGVVSGSALLVDYVLTITVSIASGADAVFSFLPPAVAHWKLPVEFVVILLLGAMNLRGVKESVQILTPIFIVFLVTHAILIVGVIASRAYEFPVVTHEISSGFRSGLVSLGFGGMAALFLRAYSMGAGTYTGIEAVSNGLQIMREPKVETGKRTMVLMASSLAITAAGITFGYLLIHAEPVAGKTMNAVLLERFAGAFRPFGIPLGVWFVTLSLVSEALLLFVAAQAGFVDGPRVMANLAIDSWMPHRFAQLSDRLTMQNGVVLIGGASLVALLYTHGDITTLVTMYSINVFLTFSLSQLAMCRYWVRERKKQTDWSRHIVIHVIGLVLCVSILVVSITEKFLQGGWVTLAMTALVVVLCFMIRAHYRGVQKSLRDLDTVLEELPKASEVEPNVIQPRAPTAALLVGSYAGLGVHTLLSIQRLFPGYYKNFIFLSVGVIDSATFKDIDEVREVKQRTEESLKKYVELAHRLGLAADYRMSLGTEAVAEAEKLCASVAREFPRTMFVAGKLIFQRERWYQSVLHNETGYQLQRRLQFAGMHAMVMPIRIIERVGAPVI